MRGKTPPRVSNYPSVDSGDMSLNDEQILASSESFWEVGKFMRAVTRIDNGHSLCSSLRQLIKDRAEIEKSYAKQLSGWTKKWNDMLDKGPEYGTTQAAWRGVLEEADKLSDLHTEVGEKLVNNVTVSIKQWQKENYHKSMMHFKETKDLETQFRKAQKPWEKKLNKLLTEKKNYHNACRQEKSTANQENNARGDSALSPDALKKLQEKLRKCQADVENTHDKYTAALNDLNGYNAKYMEDMNEVFDKCQASERKRIDFVKKIMFDIHQCLDLSVDPRYSQVYTDLHSTISNTDADKDLKWWSDNHGADMPMAWPVFEEYSPELKAISQKKTSQISQGGEGGITITSIRHSTDNFVPSASTTGTGNRNSQNSQKNESYSYNNTQETTVTTQGVVEQQNDQTPSPSTAESNPFGDPDSGDEQASQGSGSADKSGEGAVVSVPARVIYSYVADEDDEISAEAGDVITRISEMDDMGWCKAINKQGVRGLIPGSYVEDI